MNNYEANEDSLSPVDEVRQIRDRLSREFDNDVHALGAHAEEVSERYKQELNIQTTKVEEPIPSKNRSPR